MSAPRSARTDAVLEAARACGVGATTSEVVDRLDVNPPEPEWLGRSRADRTATVRRYLSRLVDAGDLRRLEEGRYCVVWGQCPISPPRDPQAATTQTTGPPDAANPDHPTRTTGDPTQDAPSLPRRPLAKQTSALSKAGHNPEETTVTETTVTETAEHPGVHQDPQTDGATVSLRPLLDDCPRGPWPAAVYDALDEVEHLDQRRAELVDSRAAALEAASAAEDAEAAAIVAGDDTSDHARRAVDQRAAAAAQERALAKLDVARVEAARTVLDAQDVELTTRAHAARRASTEHWARRAELVAQLADHDGDHWSYAAQHHYSNSANHQLRHAADGAARRVAAVRAVRRGMPLGFLYGASTVTAGSLGTLAGAGGLPPLLEVTTLNHHEHDRDTADLAAEVRDELAQTPMP